MSLYRITSDKLEPIAQTSFAAERLLERQDLQRLLKQDISVLGEDLMVISEEFGDWEESRRRIDLLCLNKESGLVVVEVKRTEDGGHMELQALRYAAMVSSMTMDQVVEANVRYSGSDLDSARAEIAEFLDGDIDEDISGEVRIMLVAANFSTELTTAVLWLNKRDINITCIRLRPYRTGDDVLIDATQIIPLPEAADYEIKVKAQEKEKRQAKNLRHTTRQKFWTQFIDRARGKTALVDGKSAITTAYLGISIGRAGIKLYVSLRQDDSWVECLVRFPKNKERSLRAFKKLLKSKDSIEAAFGEELEWDQSNDRIGCGIYSGEDGGWKSPESEWPGLQDRLIDKLIRLDNALRDPIHALKF